MPGLVKEEAKKAREQAYLQRFRENFLRERQAPPNTPTS